MPLPPGYHGYTEGAEPQDLFRGIAFVLPFAEGVPLVTLDLSRLVPASAVYTGQLTVSAPGVRIQLPDLPCRSASIRALPTNTGSIYLGNDHVDSGNGYILSPGDTIDIAIDNLRRLYLEVGVANEGICYIVLM